MSALEQCDAWNAAHPIGCRVWLTYSDGEQHKGRTESAAFLYRSAACIHIAGRGIFLLKAVSPRANHEAIDQAYADLATTQCIGW